MLQGLVFVTHKTQAVRLPVEACFNENVKKVFIRKHGLERILCPVENSWDSFFLSAQKVSDDFMAIRAEQTESVREEF